jgi:hypothetical protein
MKSHHMTAISTLYQLPPGFYGAHGGSPWIDRIWIPDAARPRVRSVSMWKRAMRKLQIIPAAEPRDRCPMVMEIDTRVACMKQPTKNEGLERPQLDTDLMMKSLTKRVGRGEPAKAVEQKLAQLPKEIWRQARIQRTPDQYWELFVGALRSAALEVSRSQRDHPKLPEQIALAQQRVQLLGKKQTPHETCRRR